jgi:tight adherence protein C
VFGPLIKDAADRVAAWVDRAGSGVSLLKIRQAGWFGEQRESEMLAAYRIAQLKALSLSVMSAFVIGQLFATSLVIRLALFSLALVVGATRTKGRLNRAIDTRRELMKIEIYTVNQLMAMRVRAGGGVVQAVQAIAQRGRGEVVDELKEALRLHRAGWAAADAFRRIAELTPEPFCSRTYRLFASADERGADLAGALLSLSEDVRETRRESIKRTATKRRAAMLIPTIAILAPVLILFVAAPLPYLITSWQ